MIVPMKKALLVCLREDREAMLTALQRCGELMPIPSGDAAVQPADAEALCRDTDALLRALRPYRPRPGLFDALPEVDFDLFRRQRDESKALAGELQRLLDAVAEREAAAAAVDGELAQLLPWLPMTSPVEELGGGRYAVALTGFLPPREAAEAAAAVRKAGGELETLGSDANGVAVVVVCLLEQEPSVRGALKASGFSPARPPVERGLPSHAYALLEKQKETLLNAAADDRKQLALLSERAGELELLDDQYRAEGAREAAPVGETAETVYLCGWVRSDRTERVEKAVRSVTDAFALRFDDSLPEEKPPTVTKNNRFVTPFETITDLFSRPDPRGIDPNPVLAPWSGIIFGLMMGDVGYGLLMGIGLFVFKKLKKPHGNAAKLINVMYLSSVTTVLAGLLFGSFFGMTWKSVLDQNNEPITVLIFTLVVGVLHIFSGMILKMVQDIRGGRVWDAVFDELSWMVLITGAGLLFLPATRTVGAVLAVAGAATVLLTAGRAKKNVFGKIAGGLGGLYNITGYLSDILSYSRIFALSLATGVIAMVMNMLAGMVLGGFSGPLVVLGVLFAALICIVGHAFNLAMGLLSAYVHDSRLQYIEFFNKFYEGGGDPFTPLSFDPRHVNLVDAGISGDSPADQAG